MTSRFRSLFRIELRRQILRPLFWVLIVLAVLFAWGLSQGQVTISSGGSQVGGTKAWITSQFAQAQLLALLSPLLFGFFLAVAAGMTVLDDEEAKIEPLLHSSPLTPREYVWAKFAATLFTYSLALGAFVLTAIATCHLLPAGEQAEVIGPFRAANYLVPAVAFAWPMLIFVGGASFAVGALSRRPIAVFFLPTAMLLISVFFLWEWSPGWLDLRINQLLMLIDPAGFRWLNETWLKVDRGVDFYNQSAIPFDRVFWANRGLFVGLGLGSVLLTERRLALSLRGKSSRPQRLAATAAEPASPPAATHPPLAVVVAPPGFLAGAGRIARAELGALAHQPGLYLFAPLILLQTLGSQFWAVGAFDMPLLVTSGTLAASTFNTLSTLLCFLILFYTVESFERERRVGLSGLFDSSPIRTASILLGKSLANALVGAVILVAALLGALLILVIQGRVPISLWPFALVWGLLLLPTLLLWSSFVGAVHALTRNRYASWAIGFGVLAGVGILQFLDKISWASSFNLWGAVRWSDIATFELDRSALILNRSAAIGLAFFFVVFTALFHPRRETDSGRRVDRLRPRALFMEGLRLLPWALPAIVLISILGFRVADGPGGEAAKKRSKDYWAKNRETYKDVLLPAFAHVELEVELEPSASGFRVKGRYDLVNRQEKSLRQVPLTIGDRWQDLKWTMNGAAAKPEDRAGLEVFTPPTPLAPGDTVAIGFEYSGRFPTGTSKLGGGTEQFVLPSSIVLTSFEPTFVPVVGFVDGIGIYKDENRTDAREYPEDFHVGITPAELGSGLPFSTCIQVSAPAELEVHSVGVLDGTTASAGRRTWTWVSDQPVQFFNIVAGRWQESKGQGTAIYYHPGHTVNIPEMQAALDASRRRYSEWFGVYPWKELKLSEFASLAYYAQGFPTNITFSEGIGFLAKDDPRVPAAFMVTAHEAAHQWWGNLLVPGRGPSGVILSEGMSHYSALLLIEAEKGARFRMELAKRFEERYAKGRQVDSERSLTRLDGSRAGDNVVIYEKGGWVFWMLEHVMGRAAAHAGLREFIDSYRDNPDHPVMEDYLAIMRQNAPDPVAFDAYAADWFRAVVMPEYRIRDAKRERLGSEWIVTATIENVGTGRLPIDVAVTAGERFPDADAKDAKPWQESRTSLTLGPGEKSAITLRAAFEPSELIVDPDVQVLQLERNKAVAKL